MYTTCLFCNGKLGRNEAIEHFPVGRRLAFDAEKGRLWVVCPRCARWNLTPLDVRWEAIEEAERAYRDTRLRAATENVGLARLREGTELVRIGKPLLPEFASWRYGEVFRRRLRRAHMLTAVAIAAPVAYIGLSISGAAAAIGLSGSVLGLAFNVTSLAHTFHNSRRRLLVRGADGRLLRLAEQDTWSSRVMVRPDGSGWWLRLAHRERTTPTRLWRRFTALEGVDPLIEDLTGDAARRALSTILPWVNKRGALSKQVEDAVELVSASNDANDLLMSNPLASPRPFGSPNENYLTAMSPAYRLALEMSLHEADERSAMNGELSVLEARWREAEEVAAISDSLLMPANVEERIAALARTLGQ